MFSLVYAGCLTARRQASLQLLLLIPVAAMLILRAYHSGDRVESVVLLLWAAPYYLLSCGLLLKAYVKEHNQDKRRNRLVTTVIMVPTLLAVLLFIYTARVVAPGFAFFNTIAVFISFSLGIALLCTFVYGVLGVKLRFENDPLEDTMKAVSSGTAILNHTIKNEIGKIAISTEILKRSLHTSGSDAQRQLQVIAHASEHMLAMMSRIHSQMNDIVIREQPCRLHELVDGSLRPYRALLENAKVAVETVYDSKPLVLCDPVHLQEVFGNLIMNAVEAMPGGGRIMIRLASTKRGIELTFRDTGLGIGAGQLSHVFEPFFSTKNRSNNFGLGLSYAYNVMSKSRGRIELSSREHEGVIVTLRFPVDKLVASREEEKYDR